jgi:ribose 5-phosphate isomerase RpiB
MIAIGSDHGGVELKDFLVGILQIRGFEVREVGTQRRNSVDCADLGRAVLAQDLEAARSSREHNDANILVHSAARREDRPNRA